MQMSGCCATASSCSITARYYAKARPTESVDYYHAMIAAKENAEAKSIAGAAGERLVAHAFGTGEATLAEFVCPMPRAARS